MAARRLPTTRVQADLQASLQRQLDAAGAAAVGELLPSAGPDAPHPRTARVNALKMGVDEALQWLRHPPPEHAQWVEVVRPQGEGRPPSGFVSVKGCRLRGRPESRHVRYAAAPPHRCPCLPRPVVQGKQAALDGLLPDLLAFPPGTDLHNHPLVDSGALILQARRLQQRAPFAGACCIQPCRSLRWTG